MRGDTPVSIDAGQFTCRRAVANMRSGLELLKLAAEQAAPDNSSTGSFLADLDALLVVASRIAASPRGPAPDDLDILRHLERREAAGRTRAHGSHSQRVRNLCHTGLSQ